MAHNPSPTEALAACNTVRQYLIEESRTTAHEIRGLSNIAEQAYDPHLPDDNPRIERDQMFLEVAEVVRKRSTCMRGKVGCVIVRENRIIASGYNGAPPGEPHCFELGCDVDENNHAAGCQRAIHAEANAIAFAARGGVETEGATMYCTHGPCLKCAQLMISAGIKTLHYIRDYRDPRGKVLFMSKSSDGLRECFHHKTFRPTPWIPET